MISATLIEPATNARMHKAVVDVQTDGVSLVDPATHPQPKLDEAHLRYQLDDHDPVTSTSLTCTFDDLRTGEHQVRVSLVSNDNHPIGKEQLLKVRVP